MSPDQVQEKHAEPASVHALGRQFGFYRFVSRTYFYLPILIVAFYLEGATVMGLALLTALYGVSVTLTPRLLPRVVGKPPHARLAAGELLRGLGLALVAVGLVLTPATVAWVLVALGQVVGGVGFGVGAGQDSRLLRERLSDKSHDSAFATIEGRTQSLAFATVFFSGFVGVVLLELVDPAAPFAVGAVAAFLSSRLGAAFGDERAASPGRAQPAATGDEPPPATPALPAADRWIAIFYAATRGMALTAFVFLLPLALVIDRPSATLELVAVLGCFSLAAFVTGRVAGQLVRSASDQPIRLITASTALMAGCLVALALAATTEGDVRWLFAALSALCGGVTSAIARPMCFGALSKEGLRAKATERAERLCSAVNVSAVILCGAAVVAADEAGWIAIAIGGSVLLLSVAVLVLQQWPVHGPDPVPS